MGIMIFMLKSQRRAFRWPNNLCARLYLKSFKTPFFHFELVRITKFFVSDFIAKNCPNYKVFIVACRHIDTFVIYS